VAGVDEGVPDPALARVWIQVVVTGAKVGDLDPAYTIIEVVLPPSVDLLSTNIEGDLALTRVRKAMREGAVGDWRLMSRATMPMTPRVHRGVAEGVAREWRGRPWG
jgi:hypothetical protein